MIPLLLLLFLSFSIHVDSSDKWHFSGVLDCALESFRYHMVIYDKDHTSGDDPISHMSPSPSFKPHYYKAYAESDGDEFDSFGYELYATIIHNCNTPERRPYRKLTVDLGHWSIMDTTYYKVVNITMTNQGEQVPNEIIG
uniref:Transthyretin-like family protein n=1 Tax=Caenorhabditis tropicalis TaxID=1561998 RepID=A0A1I7U2P3_9PELO